MKVTTNNTAGGTEPTAGTTGTVDANGKVTVKAQEGAEKGPSGTAERPAWLPEGFSTPEEFRASYDKLKAPVKDAETKANEKTVEAAKVDVAALEAEWRDNGKSLKPETLEKLKAQGITEETIKDYITSRQAKVDVFEKGLADHVGGTENLSTLLAWAATNLDSETVERYNEKLTNTNRPAEARETMDLILKKFEDVNGKSGKSSTATGSPVASPGGVEPIADMQELTALQSDKRYRSGNKAFHAMVDARLAVSPNLWKQG